MEFIAISKLKYWILYRHIDKEKLYWNKLIIDKVLKECFENGVKREDISIITNLWRINFNNDEGALQKSLKKFHIDYVDNVSHSS